MINFTNEQKHELLKIKSFIQYGNKSLCIFNESKDLWEPEIKKPDSGMWEWADNFWVEQSYGDQKNIVCSYPRSGSTYLNHYLYLAYGTNNAEFKGNWHTVSAIENSEEKVLVSIRNPLDCISSWSNYQLSLLDFYIEEITSDSINDDINYYIRFMQAVLDNIEKVILIDFDQMIISLDYVDEKISQLGLQKTNNISDEVIKLEMLNNERQDNLPSSLDITNIKNMVQNDEKYQQCLDLYNQIKSML